MENWQIWKKADLEEEGMDGEGSEEKYTKQERQCRGHSRKIRKDEDRKEEDMDEAALDA